MKTTRLLTVIGILLFYSCIKDEVVIVEPGDEASVLIAAGTSASGITRAFNGVYPEDNALKLVRIIVFKANGGSLVENILIPDIDSDNPYEFQINTGTYDFVFIGNEDSDALISTQLAALSTVNTISDVESLSFSSAAFDRSEKIPMAHTERGIQITGDRKHKKADGTEVDGEWKVDLKRLATRLDVKITTDNSIKAADFKQLVIKNIPTHVPIIEESASGNKYYNGGAAGSWSKTITKAQGDDPDFVRNGNVYEWVVSRLILPSTVFASDTESDALTLECHYITGGTSVAALETGIATKYQVPRNTHILANMVITPTLSLYIDVEDWDVKQIEVVAGKNRELNVSDIQVSITTNTRARIWFSSNMPNVTLEPRSTQGYPLDEFFKDLVAPNAYNFHYDYDASTGMGTGYMDIMTCDGYTKGTTTGMYGSYPQAPSLQLNANGLTRYIYVNITDTGSVSSDQVGYFDYVGAFWKNDQVGERLITGKSYGVWSAEIVNGREWVVIGPGRSADEKVYTYNRDDAEKYPVDGDEYLVRGTGEIYFRLGAKTKNSGQPRYGRVRVTFTEEGGVKTSYAYIYLRQGEQEDYLMRKEDYGTSTTGATQWPSSTDPRPRPLANKILPYNLTTKSSFSTAQSSVTYKNAALTDYPSQAGTFFYWAQTGTTISAFHPINSPGGISGWMSSGLAIQNTWDAYMGSMESCPPGYRRPNAGSISSGVSSNNIKDSEILQSLWADPTTGTGGTSASLGNALYGYYADGFFDRLPIYDITGFDTQGTSKTNPNSAVYPNDWMLGSVGCLFFNPDQTYNASVFFPTQGWRLYGTGALYYPGRFGYYWTTGSMNNSGRFMGLQYSGGTQYSGPKAGSNANVAQFDKSLGANIRCVAEVSE